MTVIVTFEIEGAHAEFVIVHANTLVPNPNPVMLVVEESEFVIVPDPEIRFHAPIPTIGVFAFIVAVGEEIHSVWLEPAFEMVGA